MIPWLILGLIILLAIIAIIVAMKKKGKKHVPDYRVFFNLGIIFTIVGFTTDNPAMLPFGLVLLLVGFVNRKKWKKARKFSELSAKEKKNRIWLTVILGILVVLTLVAVILTKMKVI